MGTRDGNVLIYNIHLSKSASEPVEYPADEIEVPNYKHALQMFHMSSVLPDRVVNLAADMGVPVKEGSRGYVFNADLDALEKFLDIGTSVTAD